MYKGASVGVVIPALDEERAIDRVIGEIPGCVDDIVVVDNGSRDRTAEIARIAGARVVCEGERGYGAACLKGIEALGDVDIVVFLDGDYSDHPGEMLGLIDPIVSCDADVVIGSRAAGEAVRGSLTPPQRFGNWLACFLMRCLWGARFTDLGPFRAIKRDALEALAMTDRGYGWTVEMQIKSVMAGLNCREIPVSYRPRIGTSKISGTIGGSVAAGVTILGWIARAAMQPRKREMLAR